MQYSVDKEKFKSNLASFSPDKTEESLVPQQYKEPTIAQRMGGLEVDSAKPLDFTPVTITEFKDNEENIQNFEKVMGYISDNPEISGLLDYGTTGDTDPAEFLRDENIRVGSMFNRAMVMSDAPEDVKDAYRKLRKNFSEAEVTGLGEWLGAFVDYGTDVVVNPETIGTVAATIFSGGTAAGGATAAHTAGRMALSQALKRVGGVLTSSKTTVAGAYGGTFSGLNDLASQKLQVNLDEKEEIDLGQTAFATGLGAVGTAGFTKVINTLSAKRAKNALVVNSDRPEPTPEEAVKVFQDATESRQQRRARQRAEAKGQESARKAVKNYTPPEGFKTAEGDPEIIASLTQQAGNKLTREEYKNLQKELQDLITSPESISPNARARARKAKKLSREATQQKQALELKILSHEQASEAEAQLSRIEQARLKLQRGEELSTAEIDTLRSVKIEVEMPEPPKIYDEKILVDFESMVNQGASPREIIESPAVVEGIKDLGGDSATLEEVADAAVRASTTSSPKAGLAHEVHKIASEFTAKTVGKAATSLDPYVGFSPTAKKLQGKFSHEFDRTWSQRSTEQGAIPKDFFETQQQIMGDYFEKFKVLVEPIAANRLDGVLDEEANTALNNALRGIPADNEQIEGIALGIRQLYAELGDELYDNKIIANKLDNYLPRMWNRKAIENNQEGFASLLVKYKEAKDITEAKSIVSSMLDKQNQLDSGTKGHFFSTSRKFEKITDEKEFVDFINDDVVVSLQQYVSQASRSLAKKKVFDASDVDQFNKKWISKIAEEVEQSRGTPLTKSERENILEVYKLQTGEGVEGFNGAASMAADTYGLLNRMAYLPLATLSSLTEVMLNFTKGGIVNSVKGFGTATEMSFKRVFQKGHRDLMKNSNLTPEEAWREMNRFGIAIEQGLAQMDNRLSGEELVNETLQKVSNTFFKVTLLDQWTKFAQASAFATGKNLITENIENVAGYRAAGKELSRRARQQLDELLELGVDVDRAVEWHNAGADAGNDFYDEILSGAARYSNEIILQPTAASGLKSKWMSNPKSQLLFQLMSYPAAFTNTVLKGMAKQVSKDPTTAPKLIVNGMLITEVARGVNYIRSRGESEKDVEPHEARLEALKRWGANGLLFDMLQRSQTAMQYGRSPVAGVTGFFGPAVGDAYAISQGKIAQTLGTKVPGYTAGNMLLGKETMQDYRKELKKVDREISKMKPEFPLEPEKLRFAEGGKVSIPVPQAPLEPDERIDKMTGQPYNRQAGTAFIDVEDRALFNEGGYVVQPKDTLYKIAKENDTTVEELQELNNIEDPSLLAPGQKLKFKSVQDIDKGLSKILSIVTSKKGVEADTLKALMYNIADKETGSDIRADKTQGDSPTGYGRGIFQIENRVPEGTEGHASSVSYLNRTRRAFANNEVEEPEWLKNLPEDYDPASLSIEQQQVLFLGNHLEAPRSDFSLLNNGTTQSQWWGKFHQTESNEDAMKDFELRQKKNKGKYL